MRKRKFDDVIMDICAAASDPSGRHKVAFSRFLRNAMEEMNLYAMPTSESQLMRIGDNLTVKLPDEAIDFIKAGVVDESGQIRVLGVNDKLRRSVKSAVPTSCSCGKATSTASAAAPAVPCDYCSFLLFPSVWGYGSYYGERYGLIPNSFPNGEVRYDRNSNTLEFGSGYDISAGGEVVVEYKLAVGAKSLDEIPSEMTNILLHKVLSTWFASKSPDTSAYHFQMFQRHYEQFKRLSMPSIETLQGAIRETFTSSVKR